MPHSRLRPSLTHGALRLTGKRRAGAGELLVELEFSLLLVGELAGALDVLEALVDIYIAGCLVQQGAASVKASLDVGNHLVDGGEGLRWPGRTACGIMIPFRYRFTLANTTRLYESL